MDSEGCLERSLCKRKVGEGHYRQRGVEATVHHEGEGGGGSIDF